MRKKFKTAIICISIILLGGLSGFLFTSRRGKPQEKHITIRARSYAYTPHRIRVNKGDKLILRTISEDVTHGLFLEGYDFETKERGQYEYFWMRHPSKEREFIQVDEATLIANKAGKFRYRCSVTCGNFHPFMLGELIVEPNHLYPTSVGMVIGLSLACLIYFHRKED